MHTVLVFYNYFYYLYLLKYREKLEKEKEKGKRNSTLVPMLSIESWKNCVCLH